MPIFDIKGVNAEQPKTMTAGFMFSAMRALPKMKPLQKISIHEYLQRFSNPGIRRILRIVPDDYQAQALVFTLATFNSGDGGHPQGGSLALVKRMEKNFLDLGGDLLLKTRVKKVNIENGIFG